MEKSRVTTSSSPQILRLQTADFDELAERAPGWDLEYRQLSRGSYCGEVAFVAFPGLQIGRETHFQAMQVRCHTPPGMLAFGMELTGGCSARWCGSKVDPRINLALLPPNQEGDLTTPCQFQFATVTVKLEDLLECGRRLYHRDFQRELSEPLVLIRHHAPLARLRRHLTDLTGLIDRQSEIFCVGSHSPEAIAKLLMEEFLAIVNQGRLPPSGISHPSARRHLVRQAVDYLAANIGEPITLQDLCKITGASERTLHYGFQDMFGMSPMAYFKVLRLNGVRRALMAGSGPKSTVFDCAAACGFWHMGHFSADYKAMFGELPSETLKRSKKP